jgi:hypothetical protein
MGKKMKKRHQNQQISSETFSVPLVHEVNLKLILAVLCISESSGSFKVQRTA